MDARVIGIRIRHDRPRFSQKIPPIIGAGIEIKPPNSPRMPLHLPIQSIGTSSTMRGVCYGRLIRVLIA